MIDLSGMGRDPIGAHEKEEMACFRSFFLLGWVGKSWCFWNIERKMGNWLRD